MSCTGMQRASTWAISFGFMHISEFKPTEIDLSVYYLEQIEKIPNEPHYYFASTST